MPHLIEGNYYYYKVRADNNAPNVYSNIISKYWNYTPPIQEPITYAPSAPTPIGEISFALTWSYNSTDEGPDIDLHVKSPNGTEIYYRNMGGHMDYDDQGASGEGNGGGPERIWWIPALNGNYNYFVKWYANSSTATYADFTLSVYVKTEGLQLHVARKTGRISANSGDYNYTYDMKFGTGN